MVISRMKSYLLVTGIIFALIAILHLLRGIAEWQLLKTRPAEFLAMAALGVLAAALAVWAGRLLRSLSHKVG